MACNFESTDCPQVQGHKLKVVTSVLMSEQQLVIILQTSLHAIWLTNIVWGILSCTTIRFIINISFVDLDRNNDQKQQVL